MLEAFVVIVSLTIVGLISFGFVWIFVWLIFPDKINWIDDER